LSDERGHLSPEVSHFYGSASLDDSGTRVTGRFGRGPEERGGRRGGGGRGRPGGRGGRSGGRRGGR
jgi:hypothetical protein